MDIKKVVQKSSVINLINDDRLKPQEVYLLLHLIDLCNENGEIVISSKELMTKTRFTNKSMLIRYLDSLISNNYIKKNKGGGAGVKNFYKVNLHILNSSQLI